MRVYKFLIQRICPVMGNFFEQVIISQVVVIGVVGGWGAVGGLNIGV